LLIAVALAALVKVALALPPEANRAQLAKMLPVDATDIVAPNWPGVKATNPNYDANDPCIYGNAATGCAAKRRYSQRTLWVFRILASLRGLRGTRWDPFGYTDDRKLERTLIAEYERDIARLIHELTPARLSIAVEIASLPEQIRGYGHIKRQAAGKAAGRRAELWANWEGTARAQPIAASPSG
jgi:hypothetical protein